MPSRRPKLERARSELAAEIDEIERRMTERRWRLAARGALGGSPPLVEQVKRQPGFVLHVSFEDSQGFCVAEVWETKEQHDSFFNQNVVPNVPAEIKQEVIELHSLHQP